MIAVAIVGILAAIAYPSYTSQMQQTRRSECAAGLMQLASAMERDFSRNQNQYRDIITAGLAPGNCPIDGSGPATYNLSVSSITASTYTLTATPSGAAQANDPCGALTLTNQLQKGQATGMTVAQCWR